MFSVFLRSQILLAKKQPKEALKNLTENFESSLVACAGYTNLLIKTAISFELPTAQMQKLISAVQSKASTADPSVIIAMSHYLEQLNLKAEAVELLKNAQTAQKGSILLQARYLAVIADVDFAAAEQMQQSLDQPEIEEEKEGARAGETDVIQRLIEEAMPEFRKVKKTTDVDVQNVDGGACVYIPMKRKRKTKLPASYDPENPGPVPDPERWLPKWQQSRYKKYAKKRGIYLKGAQGDS